LVSSELADERGGLLVQLHHHRVLPIGAAHFRGWDLDLAILKTTMLESGVSMETRYDYEFY
jgi:hypothetical protein